MPRHSKAKAIKKASFKDMLPFFVTLMPLGMLYIAHLPVSESLKVALDGAVAGTQLLMVLALLRYKALKK